ncbi:MAG TPA: pitrilysin family protein [Candidatus Rubrimentiphilum sp.]|nr:pitrilysin family protein [Candidatus Rubrimentiphilum sp.]
MYRKTILSNGVRVITESMPGFRSASIGIWADVGSAVEQPELRGVSHMVEHMLFKGTQKRSARKIAEEMDAIGGNLNAFTDKEATCYYAKVMDMHLPIAVDVLSDMFLNSRFEPSELAKEQKVVLEEIKMYDDSPDELIHDLFIQTMWRGSNLGAPTIGFADTVMRITREDLRRHMARHYSPNSVVVAAAGNLDHDRLVEMLESALAPFAGSCELPVPENPHPTPASLFRQKDSEQAYVVLGTTGLSVRDERRYVLSVLDTILGGGMSSRLFQEIREKRGLVYTVYSFQAAYRGAGLFAVYAGTSPQTVGECVSLIGDQFVQMRRQRVGEAELRLAKEHIKGSLTLSLESTSGRMIRLGRSEFSLGRDLPIEEIEAKVEAVTADQITELAQELLSEENLGLCVLGPVDESAVAWNRSAA